MDATETIPGDGTSPRSIFPTAEPGISAFVANSARLRPRNSRALIKFFCRVSDVDMLVWCMDSGHRQANRGANYFRPAVVFFANGVDLIRTTCQIGFMETDNDFDMDFAGLDTFSNAGTTTKTESTVNYAARSFEAIAEGVASPCNVRYVGLHTPKAHVWIYKTSGWTRFSVRMTRMESAEQNAIVAQAQVAHPGADVGVSAKRSWL